MQKNQLYDHLCIHVKEKALDEISSDVRNVALIKGEINALISFCIELYSKYYLTRNILLLRKLCHNIQAITDLKRKDITSNPVFKNLIVDIFCYLTLSKYKKKNWIQETQPDTLADLEIYVLKYGDVPVIKEFVLLLSDEVQTFIGILCVSVKKKDKKAMRKILDVLLYDKQVIVSDKIEFDDILHIRDELRADIVWYLWKLLISNIARSKEEREFCRCHLYLFALYYQKKYRPIRLPLLYFCFTFLASGKSVKFSALKDKQFAKKHNGDPPSTDYLKHIVYRQSSLAS